MSNEINAVSERERNACANVFPIGGGVSTSISTENRAHNRVLAPRTRHANCRLTEEEYAQIVDRAQTLGEKPGEWVRRAVLCQLEAAEVNHPQLGRLEQLLAEFRNHVHSGPGSSVAVGKQVHRGAVPRDLRGDCRGERGLDAASRGFPIGPRSV